MTKYSYGVDFITATHHRLLIWPSYQARRRTRTRHHRRLVLVMNRVRHHVHGRHFVWYRRRPSSTYCLDGLEARHGALS